MIAEDYMDIDHRFAYLRRLKSQYDQANRSEKKVLLDEAERQTGLHRKSLVRLLGKRVIARRVRNWQRRRHYSAQVDDAVRRVGRLLDWPCAERLAPALLPIAQHLAAQGRWELTPELEQELGQVSVSTVGRIVKRVRQDEPRLKSKRGQPRRLKGLEAQVPMRVIPWDVPSPGHFEMDSVMHIDDQTRGDAAMTIDMTDVHCNWTERIAVYGRSERATCEAFAQIVARCPIPIREVHIDNGPEFLNHHLVRFFGDRVVGAELTRSRPWHKNDNRYVEHNNGARVRGYVDHYVLEEREQVDLLNALYEDLWYYDNFFQTTQHQVRKEYWTDDQGLRHVRRRHDRACSPLDRLIQCGILPAEEAEALLRLRASIDLEALQARIAMRLDQIALSAKRTSKDSR
jgi:hypothetical protein